MIFHSDYQSLTLLFFVLNELIFSIILIRKGIKEGIASDRWLGLLILLCALYMTPWMLGKAGWYAEPGYREFLLFIPFHQYFLFGPVMYFFTRKLTGDRIKLGERIWIHFIPAGLYLLYSICVIITDLIILDEYYFYRDGTDKDFEPWYQITGLVSMIIYAILSIAKYSNFRQSIYQTVSFADAIRLRWLKNFLVSLVLIITFRGLFVVIFPEMGDWGIKWWYYLIFGLISYYLGISGLMSSVRLSIYEIKGLSHSTVEKVKTGPDSETMDLIFQKVNYLFEESKLYKDPGLSLHQVAKAVESNTSILSRVINEKAQMNFNDFVNAYRVASVKASLVDGELNYKTLVGVAMDHGFNSKSTFIRSFKKSEGKTPSEYYKSINKINSSGK
ncbi:MAG: helix-turn-helix domain-containing protein [Cytophagales bacterium]|nr:helix-turn-helix domain-containing protein [Cytophagales bacterium]